MKAVYVSSSSDTLARTHVKNTCCTVILPVIVPAILTMIITVTVTVTVYPQLDASLISSITAHLWVNLDGVCRGVRQAWADQAW